MSNIFWIGCEDSNDDKKTGIEVYTDDINLKPQLYNFESMQFVSTYDLKFMAGNMSYLVEMNSAAGVMAAVDNEAGFDHATKPLSGYMADSADLVIGDQWMDINTYNPSDHSIQTNGAVYFLRTMDYEWVKFMVLSATPTAFNIQYAIQVDDSTFGTIQTLTINYSDIEPTYFDFTNGSSVTPVDWSMSFLTVPIYSPETGTVFYMPTVLLNYDMSIYVAILKDTPYESVIEIPSNVTWMQDSSSARILDVNGENSTFVYHPEPPYNHQVIVENPDYVYLLNTGNGFYKLRFIDYSSGIILFEYECL